MDHDDKDAGETEAATAALRIADSFQSLRLDLFMVAVQEFDSSRLLDKMRALELLREQGRYAPAGSREEDG